MNKLRILLTLFALSLLFINCENGEDVVETEKTTPKLSTIDVTEVTQTTAKSGGKLISDGGAPVTTKGVCWSTEQTPTISNSKTENSSVGGTFNSNIFGLIPNTTYYVRAYAINSVGTSYGNVVTFKTLEEDKFAFRDDFNGATVDENVWRIAGWSEHGGQTGRDRVFVKDGFLHLQLINDNGTILSSAIQLREETKYLYGKWEARLKPSSVPGVLNSLYTNDWRDGAGTRQEVDLELLTKSFKENSGEVHFAVHAPGQGLKSWDTRPDIKLDFNPSDDFHIWAIDITPEHVEWSVDGKSLHIYKYSEHEVKIDKPYMLKLNHWSQPGWVGGPSESGVLSTYLVDWIQFTEHK